MNAIKSFLNVWTAPLEAEEVKMVGSKGGSARAIYSLKGAKKDKLNSTFFKNVAKPSYRLY